MAALAAKPKCIVCGKACDAGDRNVDGTYAHRECLYANMTKPLPRMR